MGNIDIQRDWGWAPEYIEAKVENAATKSPEDFVIATGKTVTLEFFIEHALQFFGLNYINYLVINSNLYRPIGIHIGSANLSKANKLLAWHSQVKNLRQSLRTCVSRPGM